MPASMLARAVPLAAASLLLALPSSALAERSAPTTIAPWSADGFRGAADAILTGRSAFASAGVTTAGQHGPSAQHLPAVRENIEVVGKLELNTPPERRLDPVTGAPDPSQPPVVEGQIADVAVYKNAAYLMSWDEPTCERGGFFSVDISNPAQPRQLAFVPALPDTYHGEGAHVITINTPGYQNRDILAVNNEPCSVDGFTGFDLYDVTDPANPVTLVQGVGDQTEEGVVQDPEIIPSSYHSIFIWQAGNNVYSVMSDNSEQSGTDVDIFDITNPRTPVFIGDYDLKEMQERDGVDIEDNLANGNAVFNHDMIVKRVGDVWTLLVSYWDAGYVKVNVNDPANARLIGDSAFHQEDPLVTDPSTGRGFERPEGNGHQAEFSHDNRFVLAADEDFSTYRTDFAITSGPNAGEYESGEFGFTRPIATLPDRRLNGPTVFGGYGCDSSPQPIPPADTEIPPASLAEGEEQIVVVQRGPVGDPSHPGEACRFDEKLQNAQDAGYEGAIIANHHNGSQLGAQPDAAFCGSGDPRTIRGMCIGHRAMHLLFNDAPDYDSDYTPNSEPAVGTNGEDVAATARFDGWGYTHLYRNAGADLEHVDSFAIEEAIDERYASGFGDLSVHEFATDTSANVAYSAYYSGGMRVFTFGDGGLQQTGKFIDEGGSNFWGVEQVTRPNGEHLFAGSDRDFGLYIFRYTGPGAVGPRQEAPPAAGPQPGRCANLLATPASRRLTGSAFGDEITGTEGPDVIDAAAGDDCVSGLGGNDNLRGGTGVDTIDGQRGNDRIRGDAGRGNLRGGRGNDRITGSSARDVLFGNTGRDRLSAGRRQDQLFGGAGRDRLRGGRGKDVIEAGTGNDRIFAKDGSVDRIDCGFGRDTVVSRDRKDKLTSCERR